MLRLTRSLLPKGRAAVGLFNNPPGIPSLTPARTVFANTFNVSPVPINDLGKDSQYSHEEAVTRCKVAALFRLVDARGWSMGLYNHITARVSDDKFLVNPFGLLNSEVTASNLVKVDADGKVLDEGSAESDISMGGYTLHSAIHEARPDLVCALHFHLTEVVAVGAMKCGFLPITQEALFAETFGGVSYHDYQGISTDDCERKEIQENLGDKNKILMLRNHGAVICGHSIEETYLLLEMFVLACRSQVAMMAAGEENLVQIAEVAFENMKKLKEQKTDVHSKQEGKPSDFGQQDFEACMRYLDRSGHQTGYPYQYPKRKQ